MVGYRREKINKIRIFFLSLFMSIILLIVSIPKVCTVDRYVFNDVKIGSWYYLPVKYVAQNSLMTGVSGRYFGPDATLTRGMFVTILSRMAEIKENEYANPSFSDVPAGQWYSSAVSWAVDEDIVEGYNSRYFGVNDMVTREQMAVIIARFLESENVNLPESDKEFAVFADKYAISDYAGEGVELMRNSGIIQGNAYNLFLPANSATRAEAATIFMRLNKAVEGEPVSEELPFPTMSAGNIKYVYHGGGIIDRWTGSNSLEAVNLTYTKGGRFIELDFNWTTDNKLVCLHDYDGMFSHEFDNGAVDYNTFMHTKIYRAYTPLSLDTLAEWLELHPDVFIITDVKERNVEALQKIAVEHPEMMNRVIPQIYSKDELQPVRSAGYANIILSLYKMSWAEKTNTADIAAYARDYNLFGITFGEELISDNFVAALKESHVRLFVNTVNDRAAAGKYLSMGLSGIYTDELVG